MKAFRCALRTFSVCTAITVYVPHTLFAHVALDHPLGGETIVAGSTFELEWHTTIEHDTIGWDLWYSTASSSGPWQPISLGLPAGNAAVDVPHFYDWPVPASPDSSVWVRVLQDNDQQMDWDDISGSFAVLAAADFDGNGQVNGADLQVWQTGLGSSSGALHSDGDANLDGRVDGKDFLIWQLQTAGVATTVAVQAVPEPASFLLFLLGSLSMVRAIYQTPRGQR